MQQLTYLGPRRLSWREAAEPVLDSDLAALVRPIAVATCDLDALIVAGDAPFPAPFPLGHECVAMVIDVGDRVRTIVPGQRVSVPFQISCGACAACRRGLTGNCSEVPRMSTYGFGPSVDRWGGFLSDVVAVPFADHMLVPVPESVAAATVASASDNVGDGWRAVAPGLTQYPGAEVLVVGGFGPGSIGLYAVAAAKALGSERVLYLDPDPARRGIAQSLGAEVLGEAFPERVGQFPITVDASGTEQGINLAIRSTAPDGVCTSTAIYFGPPPSLPLLSMYTKVITLEVGRSHARRAMSAVLELTASGALRPELVTSHTVGWEQAPDALLALDWTKLVITRDGGP